MASGDRVTVRGGGVFALACAWELAKRGAKPRVVAPYGIASGASGGTVGALAPHFPGEWSEKKAFQFESLLMSADFWAGVEDRSGLTTGYARLGRIQPLADEGAIALARSRTADALSCWGEAALWQVRPASDFSLAPVTPTGLLAYDSLSARISPLRTCHALARALTLSGVEIVSAAPDEGPVLHATGTQGLLDLSRQFSRFLGHGEKGQSALLDFAATACPQIFGNGVHIVPHSDGTTGIGSTTERSFTEPGSTDHQLDDLLAKARALCPALANAPVIARWASTRPRSVTRAPILGAIPGQQGHFVANGGFKIGFGMAPKIASVMADLILDGQDAIPNEFHIETALASPKAHPLSSCS